MAVLPPDPVFTLKSTDMGPVHSICFHQNERLLAGTAKGSVHLWDLQTNRKCLYFDLGSEPVTSLHHLEEHLITQEKGGKVKCWSICNTGYILKNTYNGDHTGFCRIDYMENKNTLALPESSSNISVLNIDNFEVEQILNPEKENKTNLGAICSVKAINMQNQEFILTGYESGDLLVWDLRNSKIISEGKFEEVLLAIDYDPITNRGLCAGSTDKIELFSFNLNTMELKVKSKLIIKNPGTNCIRIRPDQKIFTTGGWDGRIRIYSWKSLRPLAVLTEHKNGGVMDISYSTGKVSAWKAPIMAAGGADGQISLWDLYN